VDPLTRSRAVVASYAIADASVKASRR
jgi:hypothetical protein